MKTNLINFANKKNFNFKLLIASLLLTVVIMFLLIENLVQMKKDQLQGVLSSEAAVAESILLDRFESTFFIVDKMGKDITNFSQDKKRIFEILNQYKANSSFNHIFSWTIFSWTDQNLQLTVDEKYGIMQKPLDLSIRDYAVESISKPNVNLLGKPVYGSTSKKWMIPGGIGFTDNNGQFLGVVNFGFEISNLAKMIKENIGDKNVSVDLIYKNDFPVFSVNKSLIKVFSSEEIASKSFNIQNDDGHHITLDKQLKNYPYHLVLKYDQKAVSYILWNVIYSRIVEIISIISLLSTLLFIIYKSEKNKREKIAYLMQREVEIGKSKTEFMLRISHELMNFVAAIIGLSDIVKENLKDKKSLDEEKIADGIEHLEHIEDISGELKSFIIDLIDLNQSEDGKFEIHRLKEKVDFEDMIERSVRMLKSKIKNKNITIETDFDDNLHKLANLDPRRIKQILVGIIGNAINYSSSNSKIEIISTNIDRKKIKIVIKDCGCGMSNNKIKEVLADYDHENYINNGAESIELKLPIIRFLVEKQNGTIEIKSTKNYGTEVIIIF
jgi:signal transduction histidine kinase